jgi:hypothetical protein
MTAGSAITSTRPAPGVCARVHPATRAISVLSGVRICSPGLETLRVLFGDVRDGLPRPGARRPGPQVVAWGGDQPERRRRFRSAPFRSAPDGAAHSNPRQQSTGNDGIDGFNALVHREPREPLRSRRSSRKKVEAKHVETVDLGFEQAQPSMIGWPRMFAGSRCESGAVAPLCRSLTASKSDLAASQTA